MPDTQDLKRQLGVLDAENDRLRGALLQIMDLRAYDYICGPSDALDAAQGIAHLALSPKPDFTGILAGEVRDA